MIKRSAIKRSSLKRSASNTISLLQGWRIRNPFTAPIGSKSLQSQPRQRQRGQSRGFRLLHLQPRTLFRFAHGKSGIDANQRPQHKFISDLGPLPVVKLPAASITRRPHASGRHFTAFGPRPLYRHCVIASKVGQYYADLSWIRWGHCGLQKVLDGEAGWPTETKRF